MANLDTKLMNADWAEDIDVELTRLSLDTSADPCSGLIVELVSDSEAVVKLFDDYASGEYYADRVLAILQGLTPEDVSLSDDSENIWQIIANAEI